jgi:methionine biosynthesis protein MetW
MTDGSSKPAAFGEVGAALHKRGDLQLITELVPHGARVLDLGSGDGLLLEHLRREKGADGRGIERDPQAILACMRRGIPVVQADLDAGLADFPDRSFDVVIISHTLQQVVQPRHLLLEAGRVGKQVVVGFPNFGHWQIRFGLLLTGRMPKSGMLPYEWYDTPNIHLLTLADFEDFCAREGFGILRRMMLRYPCWRQVRLLPGLRAAYALYLLDATGVHAGHGAATAQPEAAERILVVEE